MEEKFVNRTSENPYEYIEKVIETHKSQIEAEPENPELYYRLGILMMHVQRHSRAIECFEKALELNPTFCRAKSKLIVSYLENAQADEAMELMQFENGFDKATLDLHYKVAILYCDRNKFASSMINLQHFAQSSNTEATVNISLVLQNLGLLDRAAAMWDNLSETTAHAVNGYQSFWPDES
jgi:superkiller protein 3